MKKNIKDIVKEEVENFYSLAPTVSMVNEEGTMMSIKDLAELGARLGQDEQTMLEIFQDAFRQGGDNEVVELAKSMTGQPVYVMSRGKYSFTPVY
jgi:hypothetical protein